MAAAEFEKTGALIKDKLLLSITMKDDRTVKCKQGYVAFEKGKYLDGARHRIVIGRPNFGRSRRQEFPLSRDDFCGLINGSEFRRIVCSSCYCPTITIVTVEWSIVLTFVSYNEAKRKRKFDAWSLALRRELEFGGYWSVQEVNNDRQAICCEGVGALLCATRTKLSILTRNQSGTYVTQVLRDMEKMVRSERHTSNRLNEVQLNITFSVNDTPSHLSFKIKNDKGMTRDLFTILDKFKTPVIQRTGSRRNILPGSDVTNRTSVCRDYKHVISRRFSRDDLDLLPLLPRRHIVNQPRRMQISDYDLNAISSQNSVQDALHFYENLQFCRERNPPDVVINRPSVLATEEYWGIVNTLTEVLRKRTPAPDTLNLPCKLRRKLCFSLLDNTLTSWKDLAGYIGLTQEAVRMTETLFQSGMDLNPSNTNDILTPPECILRHWQFAHNQHSMGLQATAPPYPCSRDNLIQILGEMERHDLVHLLQQQQIVSPSSPVPPRPLHLQF